MTAEEWKKLIETFPKTMMNGTETVAEHAEGVVKY